MSGIACTSSSSISYQVKLETESKVTVPSSSIVQRIRDIGKGRSFTSTLSGSFRALPSSLHQEISSFLEFEECLLFLSTCKFFYERRYLHVANWIEKCSALDLHKLFSVEVFIMHRGLRFNTAEIASGCKCVTHLDLSEGQGAITTYSSIEPRICEKDALPYIMTEGVLLGIPNPEKLASLNLGDLMDSGPSPRMLDRGAVHLAAFCAKTFFKVTHLSCEALPVRTARHLKEFSHLTSIEVRGKITRGGLGKLVAISTLRQLCVQAWGRSPVFRGKLSVAAKNNLERLPLEKLRIAGPGGKNPIKALFDSILKIETLSSLSFTCTKLLKNSHLKKLAGLIHLKELDIANCPGITVKGFKSLRKLSLRHLTVDSSQLRSLPRTDLFFIKVVEPRAAPLYVAKKIGLISLQPLVRVQGLEKLVLDSPLKIPVKNEKWLNDILKASGKKELSTHYTSKESVSAFLLVVKTYCYVVKRTLRSEKKKGFSLT